MKCKFFLLISILRPNIHTYVYIVTKSEWHIMLIYEYMLIIINVIMIMIIVYAGKRIPAADAVVRLSS